MHTVGKEYELKAAEKSNILKKLKFKVDQDAEEEEEEEDEAGGSDSEGL